MSNRSTRRRNSRNRVSGLQVAAIAFVAVPLAMGCAAVAAAIGANFAAIIERADSSRFNLVEITGNGESDIRDHGLTGDDCRALLFQFAQIDRRALARFVCEPATVASR